MSAIVQSSLPEALDLPAVSSNQCYLQLPEDISFGSVSCGGFVASVMGKFAVSYASHQVRLYGQTHIWSTYTQFYRPIFPGKGKVRLQAYVINIGKAGTSMRVELFQGGKPKICASMHLLISDFNSPGLTVSTGWRPSPPARRVDLAKLETESDPNWICYHAPFYRNGARRSHSYARMFIPVDWPSESSYVDQWIAPGWDYEPLGSRRPRAQGVEEARWTNDMIQFAFEMNVNVHDQFVTGPTASQTGASGIIRHGKAQKKARKEGKPNWREVEDDGSLKLTDSLNITLTLSTEIKKRLPDEGIRWLYLRTDVKHIENGRLDIGSLLLDHNMDLVAAGHQVAQLSWLDKKEIQGSHL
ncbi:PKS-like enzyme [Aspergillus leporis]|uniref:PKS-like enzyme n=1 Tax=Aspergillus leporis TaxID=41062 RepID=A0A5N5WP43_9EURO|nr:PKS-like enzyme [Aspergillus leporis]